MAVEFPNQMISMPAAGSLTQFTLVNVSGTSVTTASSGGAAIGVVQDAPDAAGKAANVMISGVSKVKAGGNVTAGSLAAVGSNGAAVNASSGNVVVGVFLTGGASGDLVSLIVTPGGHTVPGT